MAAGVLPVLLALVLTGASGSSGPNPGGCSCPDKHPQQKFCDDSLVIKGTIMNIGPDEVTSRRGGGMSMDTLIEVEVGQVFKSAEQLSPGSTVYLHTYGMCKFEKMLTIGQEYILSATDAYQRGYYVVMRGCNWVQEWSTLTREQKKGLRQDYQNCDSCQITKTMMTPYDLFEDYSFIEPSPLGEGELRISYCFHNQQMAFTMANYVDCETLYSACVPKVESCGWSENKEYKRCMKRRVTGGRKSTKSRKKKDKKKDKKKKKGKQKKLQNGGEATEAPGRQETTG